MSSAGTPRRSTLVRVKRRRQEEPLEHLEANYSVKRPKTDGDGGDGGDNAKLKLSLAFTLAAAGGGGEQEARMAAETTTKAIEGRTPLKDAKTVSGAGRDLARARKKAADQKKKLKDRRYTILEERRKIGDSIHIVEVERKADDDVPKVEEAIACNGAAMIREKVEEEFVYDYYYCCEGVGDGEEDVVPNMDDYLEKLVGLAPWTSEDHDYDLGDLDGAWRGNNPYLDDDADSNAEDYFTNDYPDEEDDDENFCYGKEDSYGDDILGGAMDNLDLRSGLTSDDDDEDEDYDEEKELSRAFAYKKNDADLHGEAYARYKSKLVRDFVRSERKSDDEDINAVDEYD